MQNHDLFYRPLREALSQDMSALLPVSAQPEQIDCYCQGVAVRTAIAKQHNADAEAWAAILQNARRDFSTLFGVPYVERVTAAGGMLLFTLTRGWYTRAIAAAIEALPKARPLPGTVPAKLRGGFGRMYILSRKPGEQCPDSPAMQLALFKTLGIAERLEAEPRLLRLRLYEANDALLSMHKGVPPLQRQQYAQQSGAYGDAAARLLYAGLCRLYRSDTRKETLQ